MVRTRWPAELLQRLDAYVAECERDDPTTRTTRTGVVLAAVDRFLRTRGFGPCSTPVEAEDSAVDLLAEDPGALLAEIEEAIEEESLRGLARRAGLPDRSTGVLLGRWRGTGEVPSLRIRRALARLFVE